MVIQKLNSYIQSLCSIILMPSIDFRQNENLIREIAKNDGREVFEYNEALGQIDFDNKSPNGGGLPVENALLEFLIQKDDQARLASANSEPKPMFLVLKNADDELENPKIIAMLDRIASANIYDDDYYITVFLLSTQRTIPAKLEHHITIFETPVPKEKEIKDIIQKFADDYGITIKDEFFDKLTLNLKGLTKFEIDRILALAYQQNGEINGDDNEFIISQKSQFVKKSGMLEIIEVKETMANLGGLSVLKKWLKDKAHIIRNLDKARKYGVDIPKGVMIVGMPGCGKSLSAKITADLFGIPLVRLDVGRLLGKYIGESEANMQRALRLSEEINPCVLWIDEIEKAFAGMSNGNGHEVTVRLFGQFLTWLQEKSNSVFVVATANDLSGMPPEFLRKGRFDEIFFVDLPNFTERKEILKLHLERRSKTKTANIDVFKLAKLTDGFSGADLESVIKESFEESFIQDREHISTENITKKIKETKSISVTLKDKIDSLKERISKMDIKKASIDDKQD
ncbi:Cell division protein FtsH [Campylobacter devanensis]|uniref:Uncharacterized AAA domain-containing protein ycf46 n=1 Tax=Campylobacter devanensis TaxID=3161138 RepID=A0A1X9STW4_9BACT|nr:AAA family ATPase [Campylobacter lanienae]ARQ99713.1 ATPase, AAA family [Campylobacter lanienae]SUX02957.1 Cell division protein FtsH [Campylobacter lanienae]